MVENMGPQIWSEFNRLRAANSESCRHFGALPVVNNIHAGDGGTFACHVKETAKKGSWALYVLALVDTKVGIVMTVHDTSEPVRWESAGGIIIDSSVGAFVPGATLNEVKAMDDGDELTEAIDEALFGNKNNEAVLMTPKGRSFAVFQLAGDGTYDVLKGIDSEGSVCALAVLQP
jgi:hypothetical protein